MNEKTAPAGELTDAQIDALLMAHGKGDDGFHGFARAVIAADRALRASPAVGDVAMPVKAHAIFDEDGELIGCNDEPGHLNGISSRPMILQADAQAALAAKDAEIAALRKDLRDYGDARVQTDRAVRQAEPCAWMQNIDAALKEPLFHELRGVMGTENVGQDIALLQTLRRYRAKDGEIATPTVERDELLNAKCAEIERLKARLEVDPNAPRWDGIACRDVTIRTQDEQCDLMALKVDALTAERDALLADMRLIAETDPVDATLDPQRAIRVAIAAMTKDK